MLIGNSPIQAYLQKSAKSGIVPHAQLWIGPEHVGKTTFLENYLDLLQIDQTVGVQWYSGETLDMDTARSLIKQTTETSLWQGARFMVVTQAEQLRYQVCNALLKVLEEPRSRVTLILLATTADAIPATVRSRCITIWFQRVSSQELTAAAPGQTDLISLSHGLPGRVVSWQKGVAFKKWLQSLTRWLDVLQLSPAERLGALTDKLTAQDFIAQLNSLEAAIYSVLTVQTTGTQYPDSLQPSLTALASRYKLPTSVDALAKIAELRRSAQRPIQPKLAMTNLLLNIYNTL